MKFKRFSLIFLCATFTINAAVDYAKIHNAVIGFYSYQRAGLSSNPYNPYYTTSPYPHSSDNYNGNDLSGGWYDAGDFVKFGLPLGWSAYCLLKGYDVFPNAYDDNTSFSHGEKDNIPDILNEVKVATDWICKAVISTNSIVVDVGDGNSDHSCWGSGYQCNSTRTVFTDGGADVAGLYAASLALMSIIFKKFDPAYSAMCLTKAKTAYTYGTNNKRLAYQQKQNGGKAFYANETWQDKMACAAIELYRATGDSTYLKDAATYMVQVNQSYATMGYMHTGDLAAFEMARQGEEFTSNWIKDIGYASNNRMAASPEIIKGAYVNTNWGLCRDNANLALSAALAFMIKGNQEYKNLAFKLIDFVIGNSTSGYDANKGYICGLRNVNVHHRNASSIPGVPLVGGVVSGPSTGLGAFDITKYANYNWQFDNSKDSYWSTEVALDYNAGICGAIAFIRFYNSDTSLRIMTALQVSTTIVNLNTSSVTLTATFEKSINWKLVLKGEKSGAKKIFTGTGTAINVKFSGEVDSGNFQSSELVQVYIDDQNIALYNLMQSKTSFTILQAKMVEPKAEDFLIDDFKDGDTVNLQSGKWSLVKDIESDSKGVSVVSGFGIGTGKIDKCLQANLITKNGAAHPFAGVKTTLNSAGTPISLGSNAKSILVDFYASTANSVIAVELEQSDITDNAYYSKIVSLPTNLWERYRLYFSTFTQPDWKSKAVPLNLENIKSVRFVNRSSGTTIILKIDNFYIENFTPGAASVAYLPRDLTKGIFNLNVSKNFISYTYLPTSASTREASVRITNVQGRTVYARDFTVGYNGNVVLSKLNLSSGFYYIDHIYKTNGSRKTLRFSILN